MVSTRDLKSRTTSKLDHFNEQLNVSVIDHWIANRMCRVSISFSDSVWRWFRLIQRFSMFQKLLLAWISEKRTHYTDLCWAAILLKACFETEED